VSRVPENSSAFWRSPSPTSTATDTPTSTPTDTPTPMPTLPTPPIGPVTIDYVYDHLNRLTEANYSPTGDYFHYTYDAVGNRLTQQKSYAATATSDTYTYDIANRLTNVSGVDYTWDDNGNLLSDGVNSYGYDGVNRLTSFIGPDLNATFGYNGLGDRLQQTVNDVPVIYALDINAGLTQVLEDGTNSYLYGNDRLAQTSTDEDYFLADALGSVRQLTDASGNVLLARAYEPYGSPAALAGEAISSYAFVGEAYDPDGLTYLRARYYDGAQGRFVSRDSWQGSALQPLSFNLWLYAYANPVNATDPSGSITVDESGQADLIIKSLRETYDIVVEKDWGVLPVPVPVPVPVPARDASSGGAAHCGWKAGNWRSVAELVAVRQVADRYAEKAGGEGPTRRLLGGVLIKRSPVSPSHQLRSSIVLSDAAFDRPGAIGAALQQEWGPKVEIAHELAHYWDWKTGTSLSKAWNLPGAIVLGMPAAVQTEPGPTAYARTGPVEDWAETVAGYLYPVYFEWLKLDPREWITLENGDKIPPGLGTLHRLYVWNQFRR
jgi:RHS repeat-associated protein